ncbi:MAG: lysylphosphatidylglycerol synthase domain-containing protein [Candidatus Dormibacteria bacterium]
MPGARLFGRGPLIRSAVVTLVMGAALLLLWRHLGSGSVVAPVRFSAPLAGLALGGCGLFIVGRAWRLRVLLDGRVGMRPLVAAAGVSWGAGLLLPGPSADATFIVLARRRFDVSLRRGTSVSVLARALDLVSLGVVVVLAAAFSRAAEPTGPILAVAACGAAGAISLGVLLHPRTRVPLLRIAGRLRPLRGGEVAASAALDGLRRPRRVALLLASTALCRVATLAEYAALLALCGVHLDLWGVWVVVAVRTVLSTIPVQGLAGLGTSQVWWAGGLGVEGVAASAVVGVSVTMSLLDLAVSAPVVLACWAVGRWPQRRGAAILQAASGAVLATDIAELDAAV